MMKNRNPRQAPRSDRATMISNNRDKQRSKQRPLAHRGAFTLLEVVVAAAILGLGLLAIVRVFPVGLAAAQRSEDFTRASLLAKMIYEGLKADDTDFPVVTATGYDVAGNKMLVSCPIPIPGNGSDDDGDWHYSFNNPQRRMAVDLNGNGRPDIDFDGYGEPTYLLNNGVDDDGDGIVDDNGDGVFPVNFLPSGARSLGYALNVVMLQDGNFGYDPEPYIDEEVCNGIDDDRDGLIDEDCRLFSNLVSGKGFRPILAGDGKDNDGDGQIDEEIFDYLDRATINSSGKGGVGDGLTDEDCGLARFPWSPAQFGPSDDQFSWQVLVGVVPDVDIPKVPEESALALRALMGDLGDAVDNDGDGKVDEEIRNGLDDDRDGLVDEDCIASPVPGVLRVEIVISWGGDGEDNDGDQAAVHPKRLAVVPRSGQTALRYGAISWGIDEEARDGVDNDLDGQIDEDCHEFSYKLVGYLPIKSSDESSRNRMVMSYMGP